MEPHATAEKANARIPRETGRILRDQVAVTSTTPSATPSGPMKSVNRAADPPLEPPVSVRSPISSARIARRYAAATAGTPPDLPDAFTPSSRLKESVEPARQRER